VIAASPAPTPEVQAFLDAEDAMKDAMKRTVQAA
jgi:hypothetical protein